eukprot:m.113618 g.113618  ORF g.113618 m.113618 type:complete len:1049 (+) comp15447_c0_seq1:297-3443(+)
MTAVFQYVNASLNSSVFEPFEVDIIPISKAADFPRLHQEQPFDFVFGFGLIPPCAKLNGEATPVASHMLRVGTSDVYGQAGTIISLDPNIQSLADIEGKVVGSMQGGAADGMKYHLDMFESQGYQLFHMAKQIQRYEGPIEDLFAALVDGSIDVALTEGPWFEWTLNSPLYDQYQFNVLEEQPGLSIAGYSYPYRSSTAVYHNGMLLAMPSISPELREAVSEVLIGYEHFTAVYRLTFRFLRPFSLTPIQRLQDRLNDLDFSTGEARCKVVPANPSFSDLFSCPEGSFHLPPKQQQRQCKTLGLSCPANVSCICQPCAIGDPIVVTAETIQQSVEGQLATPTQSAIANTSITRQVCERTELCQSVRQGDTISLLISHRQFAILGSAGHQILAPTADTISALQIDVDSRSVTLDLVYTKNGAHSVSIKYNGRHIPASPFFVDVRPALCNHELQVPNEKGVCVCKAGTIANLGDGCLPVATLVTPLVSSLVLLIVVVAAVAIRRNQRLLDKEYQLDPEELSLDENGNLGEGAFGTVTSGTYRNHRVAAKVLKLDKKGMPAHPKIKECTVSSYKGVSKTSQTSHSTTRDQLLQEMRATARLRHPCITAVYGIVNSGKELLLVMERMEGNLRDMLHDVGIELDLDVKLSFLKDASEGVFFLHSQKRPLIHGDLKPSNLLVDSNLRIKVSDFGLASCSSQQGVGSLPYMSPELLNGGWSSPESDVYAFAIIIAEVLERKPVYPQLSETEIIEMVGDIFRYPPVRPSVQTEHLPEALVHMLHRSWDNNPTTRRDFSVISSTMQSLNIGGIGKSLFVRGHDQKRQEQILLKAVPPQFEMCLKSAEPAGLDERTIITICQLQLRGFQGLHSTMSAQDITNFTTAWYDNLDRLAEEHSLFGKATQDCGYMCLGNASYEQPYHTLDTASFVRAAHQVLESLTLPRQVTTLSLAGGIHCGSATLTIVGQLRPRFQVFGETTAICSALASQARGHCLSVSDIAITMMDTQGAGRDIDKPKTYPGGTCSIKGREIKVRELWLNAFASPSLLLQVSERSTCL